MSPRVALASLGNEGSIGLEAEGGWAGPRCVGGQVGTRAGVLPHESPCSVAGCALLARVLPALVLTAVCLSLLLCWLQGMGCLHWVRWQCGCQTMSRQSSRPWALPAP
jgi:hypothetical protein